MFKWVRYTCVCSYLSWIRWFISWSPSVASWGMEEGEVWKPRVWMGEENGRGDWNKKIHDSFYIFIHGHPYQIKLKCPFTLSHWTFDWIIKMPTVINSCTNSLYSIPSSKYKFEQVLYFHAPPPNHSPLHLRPPHWLPVGLHPGLWPPSKHKTSIYPPWKHLPNWTPHWPWTTLRQSKNDHSSLPFRSYDCHYNSHELVAFP